MDNVLLGKIVKSMYKLSGKTITQLSDETDLSVDTINNFFYARLQKPGFIGVAALVEATGYSMSDFVGFSAIAEGLPKDADITEEFARYMLSVTDTVPSAKSANLCRKSSDFIKEKNETCVQLRTLNEEHAKQLELYKTTQLHYIEQLNERYQSQLEHMEESAKRQKENYDRSVDEIGRIHNQTIERQEKEIKYLKRINLLLALGLVLLALGVITAVLIIK